MGMVLCPAWPSTLRSRPLPDIKTVPGGPASPASRMIPVVPGRNGATPDPGRAGRGGGLGRGGWRGGLCRGGCILGRDGSRDMPGWGCSGGLGGTACRGASGRPWKVLKKREMQNYSLKTVCEIGVCIFMGNKNFNIKPRLSAPSWLHITATARRWPPPPLHALFFFCFTPSCPQLFPSTPYSHNTQHKAVLFLSNPLALSPKKKKNPQEKKSKWTVTWGFFSPPLKSNEFKIPNTPITNMF